PGTMRVVGTANFDSNVTMDIGLTVEDFLISNGNVRLLGPTPFGTTNTLTVNGNTTHNGKLTVTDHLVVTGATTSSISNALTVGTDLTVSANATVGADLIVGNDVQIDNDAQIDGSLTVNNLTQTLSLQVDGLATISGELTMEDNIDMTLNGRVINLDGPIDAQDAATKAYVDGLVSGGLSFKGSFRADTGEILSGSNAGSYLYNCPGGAGTRVAVLTGDYYIIANTSGQFYCSGDLLNINNSIITIADAAADSSTVNDWATLESDNVEGTGIANKIPVWTDSQVLGDSMLSQDAGATTLTVAGGAELEDGDFVINRGGDRIAALQQTVAGTSSYGAMVLRGTASSHTVTSITAQDQHTTFFNSPSDTQISTNSALRIDNATRKVYFPQTYTSSGATADRYLTIGANGEIKVGENPNSNVTSAVAGTDYTLTFWADGVNRVIGDSTLIMTEVSPGAANPYSLKFGGGSVASGIR
uniref:hypothetical protein n=1 Tax=Escherichia coli TaxID=562 RepID=UPI000AA08F98